MTIRRFPRSRQLTIPYPATLDLSFVGRDTLDPRVTFARADATTCATYFDATGVLQTAAANVPRFDYNPSTLAARGFLIEESRTNSIRNNTMQGAAAGTPGTLPTNWSGATTVDGLSREVVGTGTENGISYIDVRYSGTSGVLSNTTLLAFEQNTQITATNGQTWTASVYLKLAAGNLTNVSLLAYTVRYLDSGASSLTSQNTTPGITASLTRYSNTFAAANASTAFVNSSITVNFADNSPVDFTLRIGLPQLELGAFATSVIPTTTGPVTREADAASITTLTPWYNATEGTLYAEFSSYASVLKGIVSLNDGTIDNRIQIFGAAGNPYVISSRFSTGGTTTSPANTGSIALNAVGKAAMAYAVGTDQVAISVNGAAPTTASPAAVPTGINILQIGAAVGGVGNTFGHIRRITYYPVRLSNTDLQAITA